MTVFKKAHHVLSNTSVLVFLCIILGIYLLGLLSNQHVLINKIESFTEVEKKHNAEVSTLKKEIKKRDEIFVIDPTNACLKIPYNANYVVISPTFLNDWCNARLNIIFDSEGNGFDIWFPSTYIAQMRGAAGTNLYVMDKEIPVYSIQIADAQNKTINQYDTIITGLEQSTDKLIQDTVVSKRIIEIHDQSVLFVTTKDVVGRTVEHYIFDNGMNQNKKVFRLSFYQELTDIQKQIILNSFSPRF